MRIGCPPVHPDLYYLGLELITGRTVMALTSQGGWLGEICSTANLGTLLSGARHNLVPKSAHMWIMSGVPRLCARSIPDRRGEWPSFRQRITVGLSAVRRHMNWNGRR